MQDFQKDFLQFVIANNILRFGEFRLKSGRVSPYFFNAGLFDTGKKLGFLAKSYAAAIADSDISFDVLFGPAYKGIPLAAATVLRLDSEHNIEKPYCFNRKEAKDYGEGGSIIGADLSGQVMIIDDVITAGTAIREAVEIIHGNDARLAGITVAMDRQERGTGTSSAIQEIEQNYNMQVVSIITLQNIIDYLQQADDAALQASLPAVEKYREEYGV